MTVRAPKDSQIAASLYELGIRPKSYAEGIPQRSRCPKCDGGREKEDSLTVTIDRDRLGAVWTCHRATCGWTDNLIVGESEVLRFTASRPVRKPEFVPEEQKQRSSRLYDFFDKRGISQSTVDAFGCYIAQHWFHEKGENPAGEYAAIVFPYVYQGEVVNRKYRSPHKQIMQEGDPLPTLFNVDSVKDKDHIVWVEGETDCMAVYETGWQQVVSLKDGAPTPPKPDKDGKLRKERTDRRYDAMEVHAELLDGIEKIYLAGDADEPGRALMEELARRLGRHRCWLVAWPEGCKDACEVLQTLGHDAVNECIANAKPYPIEGIQEVTGQALVDYLDRAPPAVLSTGLRSLDRILQLPGEGRLITITGVPNSGKSPFMIALMMHLMLHEDRRFLVFSPEMQPWEEFSILCTQVMLGKPARKYRGWMEGEPLLNAEDLRAAGDWLNSRLRFLASDAENVPPTLEWILDRGVQCALRLGITDLVIDPWNEIDHQRGGATETDYTGRALQQVKAFCYRHGCNVWIIVHPAKMRAPTNGDPVPPPGAYDINGSANFANKSDLGLTIHRPEEVTKVIIWKSRFYRWGKKASSAELYYDPLTGRYRSPDTEDEVGGDAWG